jgi:hypothetical protein
MKIPFKFLPASWGLKGKTRELAQAEYELDGYQLEMKLAEINHRGNDTDLKLAKLKIDYRYSAISAREYREKVAHINLTGDALQKELLDTQRDYGDLTALEYKTQVIKLMVAEGVDQELEMNEVNFEHGVITEAEFNKRQATIKGEPYIAVINSNFKPEDKLDGLYFEFDWNDLWIEELKAAGYQGFTDDQIVERWFQDLCRGVADSGDQEDDGQPIPFNSGRTINKVRRDGGPTEYS